MKFREAVSWKRNLLDTTLHGILAAVLPGHWWFQFLPDILTPAVWTYSWTRNRFLCHNNPILRLHRGLHMGYIPGAILGLGVVTGNWKLYFLGLQWTAHLAVDTFTHRGTPFAKSIL